MVPGEFAVLVRLVLELVLLGQRTTRDLTAEDRVLYRLIRESHDLAARRRFGEKGGS